MPGLLDLPAELIPAIFSYLDDNDFLQARCTCRFIEDSSLSYFGRRFFRKRGYLITSPSLNVLTSIATHPKLRKYPQHIWFNPDLYTFVTPDCAPDPGWPYAEIYGMRKDDDKAKYEIYLDCIHDHSALLYTSKLSEVLKEALKGLPNLQAIGMRRSEDHRPWGWKTLTNAIGQDPRTLGSIPSGPMSSLSGPTYLFVAIVDALAATPSAAIKRFYTDAVEIDNVSTSILSQEKLVAAFHSLLYLEINASKAWLTQKAKWCDPLSESNYGTGLTRLLKATPKLLELGLQIFRDLRQSYLVPPRSREPESWRESYPFLTFQNVAYNIELAFLTRVKLEKLITDPSILINFLAPSQNSLWSLKLRDIRLLSSTDEHRPWRPFFHFLREKCRHLEYMLLYHLMYEHGGISFVEQPPMPTPYLETNDSTGAPNPPYGEPAGGELFTKYDHIAIEANSREAVEARLESIVERHWYQQPIFSYAMDEGLWHSDTSDEEW